MVAQIFAIIAGSIAVLGTVIPILRHDDWWIRIFDFPRIHMLVIALLAAALFGLGMRDGVDVVDVVGLVLSLAAAIVQAVQILPYTRLVSYQVEPANASSRGPRLALMVANVLMSNREVQDLVDLVRLHKPDLLLAVETNAWWVEALSVIEDEYPTVVSQPLDNTYGMILYSRIPLEGAEVRYLIEDNVPSIHAHVQLSDGSKVRLYFLHPRPPFPTEDDDTTERDAELLVVGRHVAARREMAIVAGDLNDVAWSHTTRLFQRISGMLDPRVGRGMYSTFHAGNPLLRWPLDHIFFTAHFKLVRLSRLPSFGSDHFPILVELERDPDALHEQEQPEADASDREEAVEKIQKARVED